MSDPRDQFIIHPASLVTQQPDGHFASPVAWFPWFQGAFHETVRIEGIAIDGWLGNGDQPPLLTLLLSDDGENWLSVWTQPLHEPQSRKTITHRFPTAFAARHARLRADGYGSLGFASLTYQIAPIKGDETLVSTALAQFQHEAAQSPIVFAALFNESDAFLARYIDNFLAYTPGNVCLTLNFPVDRTIPLALRTISPRVHIFNGTVRREKWGHTLLLGHIESFEAAQSVFPDFAYFATMASNGLLVRPFDAAAALQQLPLASKVPVASERAYERDTDVDVLEPTYHGTWMWHHFRNTAGLGAYLHAEMHLERASVTQIEGLFARRADWQQLANRRTLIEGLEDYVTMDNFMAMEELLATSVFNAFGSGEYTHICRVLWSGARQVTVDDMLAMVPHLPAHLCALKWFDRSPTAQSTLAVTTAWGRHLLEMGQSRTSSLAAFQETTLASRLVQSALQSERYGPITNRWWHEQACGKNGFRWTVRDLVCERQQLTLDIPNGAPSRLPPASLFLEATGHKITVSLSLQEDDSGETVLRMACSALTQDGTPVSGVHLQGYLYLSALQGDTVFRLTIPRNSCQPPGVLARTVFYDEYSYVVDYADRVEQSDGAERFYFARKAPGPDSLVWLGLPLCCNARVEVMLAAGPNFRDIRIQPN